MRKFLPLLLIAFTATTFAQTPCNGGSAAGFPCDKYDLQAQLDLDDLDASFCNDSWGWTDPDTGIEYALIGLNNGTAFVDISDPINPVLMGKLETHNGFLDGGQIWRDVKVYNNHAFIVSEINNHGMQVFDLTRLRSVTNPPEDFTEDGHYDGFGSAHNIVINEDSGYAYGVGTQTFSGGPHFVNIQDPTNPVAAGGYSQGNYTHDAQVVTYTGPDSDWTGSEILIGSNTDEMVIVDITDKNNPDEIATISYSNVGYTHQGWFTDDQKYFIVGDETDEIGFGFPTRTIIFDFTDLDNPELHFEHSGNNPSTDHNGYVAGNYFFMASYRAGMRVFDISDIDGQTMTEVGYFDSHPPSNAVNTNDGAWNVYPYFASGNIIISDQSEGFLLVKSDEILGVNDIASGDFGLYPNPTKDNVTIMSTSKPIKKVAFYNVLGQRVLDFNFANSVSEKLNIESLTAGLYLVKINDNTVKRLIVN